MGNANPTAALSPWHRTVSRLPTGSSLVGACPPVTDEWCESSYSKGQVRAPRVGYLGLDVCREHPAVGDGVLRFSSTQELEVVISQAGRELWRWSDTQDLPRVHHTLGVEQGECLRWRTTWNGTTSEGRLLPAGDYDVQVTLLADLARPLGARTSIHVS